MSIVSQIDADRGLTYVLWDGVVTGDEFTLHIQRLLDNPEWPPPGRRQLTDLRYASVDRIDEATLQEAASLFGSRPDKISGIRGAIVAGEAFAKAQDFERFLSKFGPSVIVFNSMDVACTWLGVDQEEAERAFLRLRAQARGAASAGG